MARGARALLKAALCRAVPTRYVAWSGRPEGMKVALTFDDGPHPRHTPEILAALAEAGAPATFFVVGREVERYPEVAAQMIRGGHELGNHTFSHANLRRAGWRRGLDELRATDRLLRSLDPRFRGIFRPPWGLLGPAGAAYALLHRRPAVMWTLDSRDHALDGRESLRQRLAAAPLAAGAILLFHDDNPDTAAALPAIIADIRARGFTFATVSELLG